MRALARLLSAFALAGLAHAQLPTLERVEPLGATRGSTVTLELRGKALGGAAGLAFDRAGLTVVSVRSESAERALAEVAVAPDAPLGPYAVRVRTNRGVSGPLLLQVGALPIVAEVEPNSGLAAAQPLALGVTVHGTLAEEDVDHFVLAAPAGTPVRAVVEAVRLGSATLDPVLEWLDEAGAVLARSDDDPLVRRDAIAEARVPSAGRIFVRLGDAARGGARDARYRLHVDAGAQPRISAPLAVSRDQGAPLGARLLVGAEGPLLSATPTLRDLAHRVGFVARGTAAWWPEASLAPLVLRVSDVTATLEREPNDTLDNMNAPESAPPSAVPCAFEGALQAPGDVDRFRFDLAEGQVVEVALWARRLRSPLDGVVEVLGPDGRTLAREDDSDGPDPVLRVTAKAAGTHSVRVSDHLGRGGPSHVHRIEVTPVTPRISATLAGAVKQVAVPRGGRVDVALALERIDVDGQIALALEGLPPGVTAAFAESPTPAATTIVVLEAAPDAALADGAAVLSLAHGEGEAALRGGLFEPLVLAPGRNNTVLHAHTMERLTVAVAEPAPFTPTATAPGVALVRSGRIEVAVDVARAEGYTAPVTVSLVGLPAGVRAGGGVTLDGATARATFTLEAAGDARLGAGSCVAAVEGVVDGTLVRAASAPMPFAVVAPYLSVKARGAAIEQGTTGELFAELARAEGAPAVAPELVLVGLPHDVAAPPVVLDPSATAATFSLTVGAAAPHGAHKGLAVEARFTLPEGVVVQTLGGLELRVLPPAAALAPAAAAPVTEPAAAPASRLERLRREHAARLAAEAAAGGLAADGASAPAPARPVSPVPAASPVALRAEGSPAAATPSFANDVLPVLTARGCNAGACHGASQGQDGFHLSLFGYDAAGDHFRLTRERFGRRVDLAFPEQSLLLTKATGTVPHTGGALLAVGDPDHTTLAVWVRAGAPADPPGLPTVTAVTLAPTALELREGDPDVALRVVARYSDGAERDVTRLALLRTDNAATAALAPGGVVHAGQRGEAFVTASFATETVGVPVVVRVREAAAPWRDPADEDPNGTAASWIDTLLGEKLSALDVPPSALCTDEEFLRRVTLDLVGLLPTDAERATFLADPRPSRERRAALVDTLVARPEFIDQWAMRFAELLRIRSTNDLPPKAAQMWFGWLRSELHAGTRIDTLVRSVLTASGGTYTTPEANLFLVERDPKVLAENVAQGLLGLRISCAQCHNHPFDRWTQDDYSGFVAFFAQVRQKRAEDPAEWIVYDGGGGETRHPVTNQPVPPRFLGGPAPEVQGRDRREVLAEWLTAPENPWFARNLANRVWAAYLGRGLVEPVDDVRTSNPPSSGALLDALAARLVASGFDLRDLAREVTLSRAYQRSSRTTPENEHDSRNFASFRVRRLRAETLADALVCATGAPDDHPKLAAGERAALLADGADGGYFLRTFGRAPRESVCACEVSDAPSLSQALHLVNGPMLDQKVRSGGVVKGLVDGGGDDAAVVDALYARALCRLPAPDERAPILALVAEASTSADARLAALEDVFVALLSSNQFLFQH